MPPVDFKPTRTTPPRSSAAPKKKLVTLTKPKSTKPADAQASMVSIGNGNSLDSDVTRMRNLAGPNGPGGNSLNVPKPKSSPSREYTGPGSSPAAGGLTTAQAFEYTGPGSSPAAGGLPEEPSASTPGRNYEYTGPGSSPAAGGLPDPTTDPDHPAGPNGPGGNSLGVPQPRPSSETEYIGPGSDTFNEHYGVEDSSDSEYIGPGSDTFNEHYGIEETPRVETDANETAAASDEPFVIPDGDEDNPYEGHNATSVTVTPWDGHGEDGNPNDSLSSILINQGYTNEEIWATNDDGQSLIDQVAQANEIADPNIIHPGDDLVVPTRSNPTPETTEPAATEPAEEPSASTPGSNYEYTGPGSSPAAGGLPEPSASTPGSNYEYTGPGSSPAAGGLPDPTTDPNHPAGPNGPGGNSLGVPTPYDPTTDPNHPAGPNGPGGNSLNVPAPSTTQDFVYTGPGSSPAAGGLPEEVEVPSYNNSEILDTVYV